MARKPMITRTMKTTEAIVLCMDLTTSQSLEKTLILPRVYKDNKTLIKAVNVALADETIKPVFVKQTRILETLYGMTEQEFINSAKVLDPTTRTPINTLNN